VKDSVSPVVFHAPATAGESIGVGDPGAGGAESSIVRGAVPLTTVFDGRPVSFVGVSGAAGVVGVGAVVVAEALVVGPAGALAELKPMITSAMASSSETAPPARRYLRRGALIARQSSLPLRRTQPA
jgi:hypothetical protein